MRMNMHDSQAWFFGIISESLIGNKPAFLSQAKRYNHLLTRTRVPSEDHISALFHDNLQVVWTFITPMCERTSLFLTTFQIASMKTAMSQQNQ